MQNTPIFVDDKPFCFWDHDLKKKNIDFLKGFDPNYFNFVAGTFYEIVDEEGASIEDKQHAAIGVRNTFSHASETLFAFLCATLQAPDFIPGWLNKYRLTDLYTLVNKINKNIPFRCKIYPDELSWSGLSNMVNQFETESEDHTSKLKDHFGNFWQRTSSKFLNSDFQEEYNSIKHGYRAKPGGFKMAVGLETTPGKPAPPENMESLGGSDYGSSFFIKEILSEDKRNNGRGNKCNIWLRNKSLNWLPRNYYYGVNLICMSLFNIKSFLLHLNGMDNGKLKYTWPSNLDNFEKQWRDSPGVTSISFDQIVRSEDIKTLTKLEITELFDDRYKEQS